MQDFLKIEYDLDSPYNAHVLEILDVDYGGFGKTKVTLKRGGETVQECAISFTTLMSMMGKLEHAQKVIREYHNLQKPPKSE